MKKPTQEQMLLEYLRKGYSITPLEAIEKFGILALSQRCTGLRRAGHAIKTEMVEANGKRYARYRLETP